MKSTRNKVAAITFVFLLVLAVGFFAQRSDSSLWEQWFTMLKWLLGFWFGSKTITDVGKSIWYRPEMDDEHKTENQ